MVKFVESDSTGLPLKRKQACSRCRRRKKRCVHSDQGDGRNNGPLVPPHLETDTVPSDENTQILSPDNTSAIRPTSVTSQNDHQNTEGHTSRFVGDSNPEAIFMEATSLCSGRDVSVRGGLGVWQSQTPRPSKSSSSAASISSSRQAVQEILRTYAWNHCLSCCPPPSDYAVLHRIYLEKLDPIFPILCDQLTTSPQEDVARIVLQQVVSLAAAADPEATHHLRLSVDGALLSRPEFCASLSSSIQTTLDASLITDRILLTRILAALSLYMQPTCPEEADIPALLNTRAVHQMYTLGLQMAADERHANSQSVQSLFCCIWALDRVNGAFYGRACLIHERDVGWDLDDCVRKQEPPFQLFLMIVGLLDKVIALYRPKNRCEQAALVELPVFEQMILDAGAARVSSSCLASVEIFYHSVAILSSQFPADVTSTSLPAPATNSRRSLAADRITSLVGQEFRGQLSYMPIIPYGVSLSLSVSYRKMRFSKVPMFRNRGKQAFRENTALLKSLDETFWTAKTMVAMAEHVLQEMDKAVASLANDPGIADSSKKAESSSQRDHPPVASGTIDSAIGDSIPGNMDWSLLDSVPDLDVFGHFDPTFNLGAVDAALEGNLDFGASSNWFDWQQLWG